MNYIVGGLLAIAVVSIVHSIASAWKCQRRVNKSKSKNRLLVADHRVMLDMATLPHNWVQVRSFHELRWDGGCDYTGDPDLAYMVQQLSRIRP